MAHIIEVVKTNDEAVFVLISFKMIPCICVLKKVSTCVVSASTNKLCFWRILKRDFFVVNLKVDREVFLNTVSRRAWATKVKEVIRRLKVYWAIFFSWRILLEGLDSILLVSSTCVLLSWVYAWVILSCNWIIGERRTIRLNKFSWAWEKICELSSLFCLAL